VDQSSQSLSSTAAPAALAASGTAQASHAEAWPDAVIAQGNPWQPAISAGIVMALIFALAVLGLSRLKKVPGLLQNLWEFTYEWVDDIGLQVIGPEGPSLMPYFFSAFVFILLSNLLGLIPYLMSPTARTDTTVALALCTFFLTHILGLRRKGFAYISHFFHILDASKESSLLSKGITFVLQWALLPAIEIIGELARPLSLAMRLFGNIFAKEILLTVLAALILKYFEAGGTGWLLMVMPLALRPGILVLGVLVSVIQAAVFVGLSMMYIGGALAGHEGHEEGEAQAHGAPDHGVQHLKHAEA
jgi:F-type H+-transporting ATPase subunit a